MPQIQKPADVAVMQQAYVKTLESSGTTTIDPQFMSSVPGLFACGDVTNTPFKQIVIAVGDGAKAALAIQQYLIHHS